MEKTVPARRLAGLIGALLALASAPAFAQVSKFNTVDLLTTFIRGVDVAHDESGGALVVSGVNAIYAQCIDANGTGGAAVAVKTYEPTGHPYGSFPRARFNSTTGNYLVVWPEEQDGGSLLLRARTFSCPSGSMGSVNTIGVSPWGESGAAIDWSPMSGKYLVAWKSIAAPNPVWVQLVNPDGSPSGSSVQISSGFGRDPGVAWNSVTNEFGVSYSGETDTGAYSVFAVVPPGNPANFRRTTFNSISGGKTYLTDLAYNQTTQHYVMSWFQLGGGAFANIAEFDNSGALLAQGIASTSMGSYDALALAYNRNSLTFLLVGIDSADQLRVAELNSRGVRFAAEQTVPTGFAPIRYPRVDASATLPRWWAAVSKGNGTSAFQGTGNVVFATATTGGGPAGSYDAGATSSGGGGSSTGCTTVQPGPDWTCVNGGWLPPSGTSTSTGSCTTVQPGAGWSCVNGSWVPPSGTTTSGGSTSSCPTVQPASDWVCVNGGWLPPSMAGGSGSSSCPSTQPGAGWICVNGNWLPPSASSSSCPTTQPGAGWICVNGNWLPPSTSALSCTTVQPGSSWVCVNGGWLPSSLAGSAASTISCPTVQPGAGWTCVSGNWLPPTTVTSDGTCIGSAPAAGWVCRTGNWLPPDSPLLAGGH